MGANGSFERWKGGTISGPAVGSRFKKNCFFFRWFHFKELFDLGLTSHFEMPSKIYHIWMCSCGEQSRICTIQHPSLPLVRFDVRMFHHWMFEINLVMQVLSGQSYDEKVLRVLKRTAISCSDSLELNHQVRTILCIVLQKIDTVSKARSFFRTVFSNVSAYWWQSCIITHNLSQSYEMYVSTSLGNPENPSAGKAPFSKPSSQVDVYSYGICLYELITRRIPYDTSGAGVKLKQSQHREPNYDYESSSWVDIAQQDMNSHLI